MLMLLCFQLVIFKSLNLKIYTILSFLSMKINMNISKSIYIYRHV